LYLAASAFTNELHVAAVAGVADAAGHVLASTNDLHDAAVAPPDEAGHVLASTNDLHNAADTGVADEAGHVLASTNDLHDAAVAGVMEEGAATEGAAAEVVGEGVGTRVLLLPPLAKTTITTIIAIKKIPAPIIIGFL